MNENQLFELFYMDIKPSMNPPLMSKHHCDGLKAFWRERFMNAYYGRQEPHSFMTWGEIAQMWVAGYNHAKVEEDLEKMRL